MDRLNALVQQLRKEIRELEGQKCQVEARLDEKTNLLSRIQQALNLHETENAAAMGLTEKNSGHPAEAASKSVTRVAQESVLLVGKKRTTSSFGGHHYEVDGQQFRTPGDLLDYFEWPHYFSRRNGGKRDAAHREIFRFAKKKPDLAKKVSVVLSIGQTVTLHDAVGQIWP